MSTRPLTRAAVLLVAAGAALCVSTAPASAQEPDENRRDDAPRSVTAYEHMRSGEYLGRSYK